MLTDSTVCYINLIALRKAKIVYNFGLSECNKDTVTMAYWGWIIGRQQTITHRSHRTKTQHYTDIPTYSRLTKKNQD